MTAHTLVVLLVLVEIVIGSAQNQRNCEYVYSDWGVCTNGTQSRTLICVCDGKGDYDLTFCLEQNIVVADLSQPCDDMKLTCYWRWTLWSECTAPCDGGNVTREQVCLCDGLRVSAPDDYCDLSQRFGTEIATCNTFSCGKTPARSKSYWMERAEIGDWPIPDDIFNCSLGFNTNGTSPKGKRYSRILLSKDNYGHPQWLYLAREWIAAKLNLASGVRFSPEIIDLMDESSELLEKCDGWIGKDYYLGMAAKQKLGRTNNNIGGLEHVDEQVARVIHYDYQMDGDKSSTLGLLIAIPAIAIVVIGVIVGLTIYYIREKSNAVVERGVFDSQDEDSTDEPLAKPPVQGGDNLSPVAEEDKFDHSDSSEHL